MTEFTIQTKVDVPAKLFYAGSVDEALGNCQKAGYQALYMPAAIDARIDAGKDSPLFQNWLTTPSIRATGKTKQGNAVVVYAHIKNYFSNPKNIAKAKKLGLLNSAGIMPDKEFQMLLDLEDNVNVFVADYKALKSSSSGAIDVKNALKHLQTIPFIGGKERAEKYLEKHIEVYGNKIGIWHSDDLKDKPVGRLLVVGCSGYGGLYGSNGLDGGGRFVGVRRGSVAEGGARKNSPKLEQILNIVDEFIAPVNSKEAGARLRALYK